jgi:hypothetical protein
MDNLRAQLRTIDKRKALLIIIVLIVSCLVIFTLLSGGKSDSIDTLPEEGSLQNYSLRARIVDGEQLLSQLGGIRQLDAVSEDLRFFAVNAYTAYKSETTPAIGFQVKKGSKKVDNEVSFKGSFGASKNLVEVKVTILNNDRVKTSIIDTETRLNINPKLPSNRKINSYIAELPKSEPTYLAEYVRSSDNISIFLNDRDPDLIDQVLSDLQKYMDDGSYDRKRIEVLFPTDSLGQ